MSERKEIPLQVFILIIPFTVVKMGRVAVGDRYGMRFGQWMWFMSMVLGVFVTMVESSPYIKVVNVIPEQYTPTTQIQDQELIIPTNVTHLEIHCEAHYPVLFEFAGDTSPTQLHVRAVRKSGPKLGNPTFSAQLIIYRVSSALSGTYHCRSVQNPVNKQNKVHVFAQEKGYRGQDPILLLYGRTINIPVGIQETNVQLPCTSWKPNDSVFLFKKSETTGKYAILHPKDAYFYNPKSGFELNLTQLDIPQPWGSYLCSPALERTFDRVYVNLIRKPESKFTPNIETIEVAKGEDLKLLCESKHEVSIHVVGAESDDSRIILKKKYFPENEFPYIASLVYHHLGPADDTEIQCVRNPIQQSESQQVLHTWNYRVVGEHDLKRRGITRYHSNRLNSDWFACWSRSSLSPDISWASCSNSMECNIRGQCLDKTNKCDSALIQLGTTGSTIASVENQTGILQCKGDGVFQQIQQFIGVSGAYLFNSMVEAPSEEKLKIEGKHVFKIGSLGEFTCTGTSVLYAGGFRWGLKTKGSVLRILEPNSEEVVSLEESFIPKTSHILAKVVLRLKVPKFVQVNCFAPFWNTTDWDSRNIRLTIMA